MASLGHGHPSKFQQVSGLGFVIAPTSLNGGQLNFTQCLAVSWAGTLYIQFRGLTGFCQIQNSLCVQVLLAFSYTGSVTGRSLVARAVEFSIAIVTAHCCRQAAIHVTERYCVLSDRGRPFRNLLHGIWIAVLVLQDYDVW